MRSTTLFIHSPALNGADSAAAAKEIGSVLDMMGHLLEQYRMIRPLQTDLQAYNVSFGMEKHYRLVEAFEDAVRPKLVDGGLGDAEETFGALNKLFEDTISFFRGGKEGGAELKE